MWVSKVIKRCIKFLQSNTQGKTNLAKKEKCWLGCSKCHPGMKHKTMQEGLTALLQLFPSPRLSKSKENKI